MEESASAEIQEEANALMINVDENSESEWEANSPSGNESQNGEIQEEANASIGNEHQDRVLVNDVTQMLESLEPPLSLECCIYRVPHDLRKLNEEAYTPMCISIGPLHHGDTRLKSMEKLKVRYFKKFVQMVELNVENLVSFIKDLEEDVRCCYAEPSELTRDNYVKMIILDASFIIVYFLIICMHEEWIDDHFTEFIQPSIYMVGMDMRLLENQLPFFVIEKLYKLAFSSSPNYPSFTQLMFEYFKPFNTHNMFSYPDLKIMHFLDLLRTFFRPLSSLRQLQRSNDLGVENLPSASQLDEVGVEFKVVLSKCLLDLKFTKGVLEIPCLKLYKETEFLFQNLVALERCHYPFDAYFSDYIRILDFLIDTPKDVDLLVQKEILVNRLGDSNAVATLVNNLGIGILYVNINSNYCQLCKNLNAFYKYRRRRWKDRWRRWMVALRRDYFPNPWRTSATIAAFVLLVLTFIQTICSIISLPKR